MSDTRSPGPSGTGRLRGRGLLAGMALSAAGSVAGLAGGCESPLSTGRSDLGLIVERDRLRSVEPWSVKPYLRPGAAEAGERPTPAPPRPDPFAGLEQAPITVEQCRAWALENNLDLKVSLIDPTIAASQLAAEEAKFEGIFSTSVRFQNVDEPTASELAANRAKLIGSSTGVRVPLRTGGEARVDFLSNYTDTSNQFATLNPATSSGLRFSVSQPLLRNAGRRTQTHSIRLASLESQAAEARAKLEVIRQIAAVERAYWRLYAARKTLEVRQQQYELADNQLATARRRVAAGDSAEVEVIRAEAGVAERLEAIILAENQVRATQRELKRVLGKPGLDVGSATMLIPATEPDPLLFDLDPPRLADAGEANRMEMLELELQLAQDLSTIDFNRNQELPLFALDYSYQLNGLGSDLGASIGQIADRNYGDHTVSATFETPIGNEAARQRTHQAILRRLQRLASKEARRQSIRREVLDALDTLNASWQRILASRQSAALAARTLQAEQNQFNAGLRTSTDVLDASSRLADAQSAEIQALTSYQIAQVDLAFATGTLLGAAKVDWWPRDPRTTDERAVDPPPPPRLPLIHI
ncbi:MAG: TolC family protein [Phycisphaerales bacterium]|nr:TolC family protein [Phycisphaerales bacterium]